MSADIILKLLLELSSFSMCKNAQWFGKKDSNDFKLCKIVKYLVIYSNEEQY